MATRSRIGKLNDDGTVTSIYCHYDGYPEWTGRILDRHWSTPDKVDKLLSLGSTSGLDEQGATGDPDDEAAVTHGADSWPDTGSEWQYLWIPSRSDWMVLEVYGTNQWHVLKDILRNRVKLS